MNLQALELSSANRPELLPDETLLLVQDGVGLYEGKIKLADYQNGHVYLTSHRVCYVDNSEPRRRSLAIPLKTVERTEHYTGFLKSSPKITLYPRQARQAGLQSLLQRSADLSLTRSPPRSSTASPFPRNSSPLSNQAFVAPPTRQQSITWVCPICSFSNPFPPGFDATVANEQTPLRPCQTCGIKPSLATLLKAAISTATAHSLSDDKGLRSKDQTLVHGDTTSDLSYRSPTKPERPSHVCPRCTFENHPSLQSCEICGASLATDPETSARAGGPTFRSDSPIPDSTLPDERGDFIKLSFRSSGDKAFNERLKWALVQRKWLSDYAPPIPQPQSSLAESRSAPGSGTQTPEPKGVGIAGLERRGLEHRRNNETVISTAFEDLEALMASAQDIINLAESFADKTPNASATEIIHDAALHMTTTKDMLRNSNGASDTLYLSELARELAEYLTNERVGVLRRAGGIMSLVDLWAEFNGLRNGVELISPLDFEKAARLWEKLALPVRLRTFRNGLLVVQRHDQTDDKTIAQILSWLQDLHKVDQSQAALWDMDAFGRGVTAQETALKFGWSVGVAVEELEMAEENGVLCREESIEGLKFWENWITQT